MSGTRSRTARTGTNTRLRTLVSDEEPANAGHASGTGRNGAALPGRPNMIYPHVIYPNAIWDAGVNAGYRAGRSRMRACVCHYTVGVDSTPIGQRGFFHFLIGRDGGVTQFAELDAVTWHAGEWNREGPGIEVEYLPGRDDEVFTPQARAACGELVAWVAAQGIPAVYYDGDRLEVGAWSGFISHRSLIQTEEHFDYWPQADWDAMVTKPAPSVEDDMQTLFTVDGATNYYLDPDVGMIPLLNATQTFQVFTISQAEFDRMNTRPKGEGLTTADVEAAIRKVLNQTQIKPGTLRVKTLSVP